MNKKIITIILALVAVCGGASAQPKNATCPIPGDRGVGKITVVDTTRIRVQSLTRHASECGMPSTPTT